MHNIRWWPNWDFTLNTSGTDNGISARSGEKNWVDNLGTNSEKNGHIWNSHSKVCLIVNMWAMRVLIGGYVTCNEVSDFSARLLKVWRTVAKRPYTEQCVIGLTRELWGYWITFKFEDIVYCNVVSMHTKLIPTLFQVLLINHINCNTE